MNRTLSTLTALALVGAGLATHAQVPSPSPRPSVDTGIERMKPPAEPPRVVAEPPDLRLETPGRSAIPRAVDDLRFEVWAIEVEGAQALDPQSRLAPFAPLLGKLISLEELRQAADQLEAEYRARGFFLVRALIPPQRVRDGRFVVRVIEGYVEAIQVEGAGEALTQRVERMMAEVIGARPVTLSALERALLRVNDLPGISARGTLRQGSAEGATELVVTIDRRSDSGSVSLNNHASKALGLWSIAAGLQVREAFSDGAESAIDLIGSGSDTMYALGARHTFAVGDSGMVASIGALSARARPVGSIRDDLGLNLTSAAENLSFKLRQSIVRSRARSVFLEGGLGVSQTRTTGLPADSSCGSGAGDAGSEIADRFVTAQLGLSITTTGWGRSRQELGLVAFQAVPTGWSYDSADFAASSCRQPSTPGFDPKFSRVQAQWSAQQPIAGRWSAQLLGLAQTSDRRLPAGERIAMGGMRLGRAYDNGAISGDRGYGLLVELVWRAEPATITGPAGPNASTRWMSDVQWFVFADYASTERLPQWGLEGEREPRAQLSSVGTGLRWTWSKSLSAELLIAWALRTVPSPDARDDPRVLLSIGGRF